MPDQPEQQERWATITVFECPACGWAATTGAPWDKCPHCETEQEAARSVEVIPRQAAADRERALVDLLAETRGQLNQEERRRVEAQDRERALEAELKRVTGERNHHILQRQRLMDEKRALVEALEALLAWTRRMGFPDGEVLEQARAALSSTEGARE